MNRFIPIPGCSKHLKTVDYSIHPAPWSAHIDRERGVDTYYVLDRNEKLVLEFRRRPGQTVQDCRAMLTAILHCGASFACSCPSVACALHGLTNGQACGGW